MYKKLLPTRHQPKHLHHEPQQIRVTHIGHKVLLNFYASLTLPSVQACNGRIYAIDSVLCPPPKATEILDMVPTKFSIFNVAIRKTGLHHKLGKKKSITLFAPDNNAFQKLGPIALAKLFSEYGRDDLERIVRMHVGTEIVYAEKLKGAIEKRKEIKTILKGPRHQNTLLVEAVEKKGRDVLVVNGDTETELLDVPTGNGVIHVIDRVLLPPGYKLPENYSADEFNVEV